MDFRSYYYLESYLFESVRPRFRSQGYLNAFDFFCIVIWKAQRAKSKIAATLRNTDEDLDRAVFVLTRNLTHQPNARDRLRILLGAKFKPPMSSAILTVLYPEEFTVYDTRVCSLLGGFHRLENLTNFEAIWEGYQQFKHKVEESAPADLALRDKDRYLWDKSFYEQLQQDIRRGFPIPRP